MSNNRIFLGPIIGAVNRQKAKIWFYGRFYKENGKKVYCHVFNKGTEEEVQGSPFPFKSILDMEYEYDNEICIAFLAEINFEKEVDFKIVYDDENVSDVKEKYSIKPFPESGDHNFSFSLISCHKAFTSVKRQKKRVRMWNFMSEKMKDHNSSFLIQCGDQVYCDADENNAWEKSKKVNTYKERLDLYRNVYFDSWGYKEVQKVMSTFPQFMIWDDHEVTNGWGSDEVHFKDPQNLEIFKAGRDAYIEFQHSHNPKPLVENKFYYAFHYGNAAFLVMDLRGERNIVEGRLISDEQWDAIKEWMNSDKVQESKILFVVTSVPVVHLSRKFASLGKFVNDIADQWTYENNRIARQKLLRELLMWSGDKNKPVFILGGDVHVGTEVCLMEEKTGKRIHQITSSPITNRTSWFLDLILAIFTKNLHFSLDDVKKEYMKGKIFRRHRRKNFALIEVKYSDGRPEVKLNMYRKGKSSPKVNNFITTCQDIFN